MAEPDNTTTDSKITPQQLPVDDSVMRMLTADHELGISWIPRHHPLGVLVIRVNGHRTAGNEVDDESPFIVPKLPPSTGGRYRVGWAISPLAAIEAIVIAVRNRATGQVTVVARGEALRPHQLWQNMGVDVDAP